MGKYGFNYELNNRKESKTVGKVNNNPSSTPRNCSLVSGGLRLLPLTENGSEGASTGAIPSHRSSVASTVSSTGLWGRPVTAVGGYAGDISEGGLRRSYSSLM